ncbi:complex I assembly factor TIMMDC1, mitochondrial [Clupea harengus]|uniref:Complex I assembly factor TIMMDC1, mitochondrial n=1 Tax=Clupea harengus TaxID=7950 RepID=A0A6P3VR87_CLUHA|nr:complex I assembly factor TIMMDC1, mitochondrial [Clupea harengus]XP_031414078.1 complex I assembly factor TIMMDC1, mitochondrial [Clupea harengus]XP_031414079.1 complex I assembly factor TIMMDC1, mitochondrial [Clupea harengus]
MDLQHPTCGNVNTSMPQRQSARALGVFPSLLPRVHAAESSLLPTLIGKPEFPDTGWERIKDIFDTSDGQRFSEEVKYLVKSGISAALVGMVYGGVPAARHARQRFIQLSQAEVYTSRVEAVRSAHNAAIRGFLRYGVRWSWRVAVFVTLFNTVSTGLCVYRDRNALSHYALAGAVTGGMFRLSLGPVGMLAGSAIGGLLGLPAGALIVGVQKLGGETLQEKRKRERRELHDLKMAEWSARLQLTDNVADEIGESGQDSAGDLKRIDEILNRPRNKPASPEPSSQ